MEKEKKRLAEVTQGEHTFCFTFSIIEDGKGDSYADGSVVLQGAGQVMVESLAHLMVEHEGVRRVILTAAKIFPFVKLRGSLDSCDTFEGLMDIMHQGMAEVEKITKP